MPILISVFCRWCNNDFCICRSCWRGQAYCGDACRRNGHLQSRCKAQQKYRQTDKGKRAHCLDENRRRYRKTPPVKNNMDDATSNRPLNMHIRMTRRDNSAPFHSTFWNRCHFCGRSGEIVDQFPRKNYGNLVYD